MKEIKSLKNHLLIAMPTLADSYFDTSVIYLCEHNEEGAMGIVINKQSNMDFSQLSIQLDIHNAANLHTAIYSGGPVSPEYGFILHSKTAKWKSTLNVSEEVQLTSSQDILHAIAESRGPDQYLISLGYAGWSKGQLDDELKENSWLTLEATKELLFEYDASEIYHQALKELGISPEFLSSEGGHA